MYLQHDQRQVVAQRIDPKIIMANSILQLTSLELVQSVESELMDNPALETLDEIGCSGDCIDPSVCPYCSAREAARSDADLRLPPLDTGDLDADEEPYYTGNMAGADSDYDPMGNIEAEITLQEHLRSLLGAAVTTEDYAIGEYIISSLDDRGWLDDRTDVIALELGVPESEVCRLLAVIQTFDPPGVGARTLQECLLLQLQYLREEDTAPAQRRLNALAEKFVRCHFEHVTAGRYARLARAAGITADEAQQVMKYIASRLNPYPASQFRPPWSYRPNNNRAAVRPDVLIRRTELGYEVEIPGGDHVWLGLNPSYREKYLQIKSGKGFHSDEERRHVLECVERAELFIRNINQRRQTLRTITRCIVEYQAGFLETGSRKFMRPLTRTGVARQLGIHESTVSRATANKFVQLPNQEVVSFDLFFDSSLAIKNAIEVLIASEDPSNPLSDQQIVEKLEEQGIQVARRTIVKYREAQKILSSARRRR